MCHRDGECCAVGGRNFRAVFRIQSMVKNVHLRSDS